MGRSLRATPADWRETEKIHELTQNKGEETWSAVSIRMSLVPDGVATESREAEGSQVSPA